MTLNIIVPVGSIHFNFIDLRENSETFKCRMELSLSVHNYIRVTIPPRICFGFKGKGEDINMLVNIADIIHDDNECENLEFNKYRFIDK